MDNGRDDSDSRDDDWIIYNQKKMEMDEKEILGDEREEVEEENADLNDGSLMNVNDENEEMEEEEEEIGVRIEGLDNPSWVFLVYINNEIRIAFSCICSQCEWKGEEETDLTMHLQSHVECEYGMSMREEEEDGGGGENMNEEGMSSNHPHFVACPIPFCNRAFSIRNKAMMESHMSMHAHHASLQKKGLIALISNNEFAMIRSCGRKEKLLSAHPGDYHVCMWDDCGLSFLDVNHFFAHCLSHMEFVQGGECLWDSCAQKFKHKSRLIPHVHHHMGMKSGACPFCGEVFSSISKLYDHVSRRMKDENGLRGSVLCKLCRKSFPNEKSLRLHIKRHVVTMECDECRVLFSTKHDLNRHKSTVHSHRLPQINCSYPNCNSIFSSNAKLIQHLNGCHSDDRLICPHCSRNFKWTKQLTKHINLEHNEDGPPQYECHMCSSHYGDGSSLTRHLKKKHQVAIPPGFPRFQYKKCEDGRYRLQTNRPFS